jgi:hypothetical protein
MRGLFGVDARAVANPRASAERDATAITAFKFARRHALPIATALVLIAPLVIACGTLCALDWAPFGEMAVIEQRVRDVGTVHTPLVGLPGRFGALHPPTHHPGPLAFWMLTPGYRVFGSSAWALYASAALLNAAAVAALVFVAWRRRDTVELGTASAAMAMLMLGYGPSVLAEPWNPYFPVLWLAVFLTAVWAVIRRDLAMLPVAAVAASIAGQTHIPYVPVCGALGAICATVVVVWTARAAKGSVERKRGVRVLVITFAVLILAWLPVAIEQARDGPGNLTRLVSYFRDPANVPIGLEAGFSAVLSRLDARALTVDPWLAPGGFGYKLYPSEPGPLSSVTLVSWLFSILVAIRLKSRRLWTLHAMALVFFAVAVLAASRIVGFVYAHVLLWTWSLAVLIVVTCAATLASLVARKLPQAMRSRLTVVGSAVALGVVALCALRLAWEARTTRPMHFAQGSVVRALALDTITAIDRGRVGTGLSGRYLVSWSDPLHQGFVGISLANELERAGFAIAYEWPFMLAGEHRSRDRAWASARIHFASGGWIVEGRNDPNAVLVSHVDLRTPAQQIEAHELQAQLSHALRRAGREDLVRQIPYDLPGVLTTGPKQEPEELLAAARLSQIGWPAAVFIMSPSAVLQRTLIR